MISMETKREQDNKKAGNDPAVCRLRIDCDYNNFEYISSVSLQWSQPRAKLGCSFIVCSSLLYLVIRRTYVASYRYL